MNLRLILVHSRSSSPGKPGGSRQPLAALGGGLGLAMGRMSSPVSGKSAGWGSTEEALASEVVGYVVLLGSGSACVGAFCMSREAVTLGNASVTSANAGNALLFRSLNRR